MAINLFTNGAGGNTWGTSGNWSQGTIPTSTDGHITTFDATSPNCTMGAARACNNIDFTGYTNTLTMSTNTLTVSGNITLSAGMIISGTGALTVSTTATTSLNFNGKTWPNAFNLTRSGAALVATLTSDIIISGLFTSNAGGGLTINKTTSETFTCQGGMTITGATTGIAKIILTGGTWTSGANMLSLNLDLQGNITVSGTVTYNVGTLNYISGTVTTTGSTIKIGGAGATFNTSGVTWNNFNLDAPGSSPVLTLTSDLNVSGLLNIGPIGTATINKTTSEKVTTSGGITVDSSTGGTADIYLTGGTWSGINTSGFSNNLFLNGNVTLSGIVYYRTGTIKYLSGTITTTGSTLSIALAGGAITMDTAGVIWNIVSVAVATVTGFTITLNSLLTANTINLQIANVTFTGTAGFITNILTTDSTQSVTISFKESITYTITQDLLGYKSRVDTILLFTSSHATTKANLVLQNNAGNTCNVLANFTRIDATGGRTINTFAGTITDCINIRQYFDKQIVSYH